MNGRKDDGMSRTQAFGTECFQESVPEFFIEVLIEVVLK